ncbi:MAG: hypothetical protein AB8B87_19465 [Granulosicoccus sp.]
MDSKIKEAIDKSLEQLEAIQEKVDDFIDDIPDDTHEIKATAKKTLKQINTLLNKAVEQAGNSAEEAQLQAHLGVMEAQEKLEASKVVVDDFISRTGEESKRVLDEVQLKQNLAMMEARDFWEQRGSKMAEEFQESAAGMQSAAEKAVDELQSMFSQFNDIFNQSNKDK